MLLSDFRTVRLYDLKSWIMPFRMSIGKETHEKDVFYCDKLTRKNSI